MKRLLALALPLLACTAAAERPLERVDLSSGGRDRSYELHTPAGGRLLPLIVALHGGGGNGAQLDRSASLVAKAGDGFIIALPDGLSRVRRMGTWNAGGCCAYAMREGIDDVGFVRDVIADVSRRHLVDPKRIYVVGMSNGGMLTHKVAIALGDQLAGAAVVVGALFGDERAPVSPLPMLLINAADDEAVPPQGGQSQTGLVRRAQALPYKPARYAADFWSGANGCPGAPVTTDTPDAVRLDWKGCRADVSFWTIKDAGHGWPGGTLGRPNVQRPTGRVDATSVILDFFRAHARG